MKRICLNNIQIAIYIELIVLFYQLTCYKKRAIKDITKEKLESLLETFTAIFSVISYIILQKTRDSMNFTTNHSVESSLRHKKKLSKTFTANKTLGCFGLRPSTLAGKAETTK